jgi:arsenate reductase
MTAHWGVADPAAAVGTSEEVARAYREAYTILDRRISLLLALPLATLDKMAIKWELGKIGGVGLPE